MPPRSRARADGRHRAAVALLTVLPALAACGDSTAPRRAPEILVAYVDCCGRVVTVSSAGEQAPTPLSFVTPVAASRGTLLYFARPRSSGGTVVETGGLRRLDVASGRIDSLPLPYVTPNGPGALSPDGRRFAYVTVRDGGAVWVSVLDLASGRRDTVAVTGRLDVPAGPQVAMSTPVFSPSGDTVAFLLPNPLSVQLLLVEVPTMRLEAFAVPVPVTTRYHLVPGSPRWTRGDAAIRFLAQGRAGSAFEDSVYVLKVFPRDHLRIAETAFSAPLPDTTGVADVRDFSFDAAGETVAFIANTGRPGLHLLRRGAKATQPLVDAPGQFPQAALLVP